MVDAAATLGLGLANSASSAIGEGIHYASQLGVMGHVEDQFTKAGLPSFMAYQGGNSGQSGFQLPKVDSLGYGRNIQLGVVPGLQPNAKNTAATAAAGMVNPSSMAPPKTSGSPTSKILNRNMETRLTNGFTQSGVDYTKIPPTGNPSGIDRQALRQPPSPDQPTYSPHGDLISPALSAAKIDLGSGMDHFNYRMTGMVAPPNLADQITTHESLPASHMTTPESNFPRISTRQDIVNRQNDWMANQRIRTLSAKPYTTPDNYGFHDLY